MLLFAQLATAGDREPPNARAKRASREHKVRTAHSVTTLFEEWQ